LILYTLINNIIIQINKLQMYNIGIIITLKQNIKYLDVTKKNDYMFLYSFNESNSIARNTLSYIINPNIEEISKMIPEHYVLLIFGIIKKEYELNNIVIFYPDNLVKIRYKCKTNNKLYKKMLDYQESINENSPEVYLKKNKKWYYDNNFDDSNNTVEIAEKIKNNMNTILGENICYKSNSSATIEINYTKQRLSYKFIKSLVLYFATNYNNLTKSIKSFEIFGNEPQQYKLINNLPNTLVSLKYRVGRGINIDVLPSSLVNLQIIEFNKKIIYNLPQKVNKIVIESNYSHIHLTKNNLGLKKKFIIRLFESHKNNKYYYFRGSDYDDYDYDYGGDNCGNNDNYDDDYYMW